MVRQNLDNMKYSLFYFFICICSAAFSQARVDVQYEEDTEGKYKFYCINENYCNYTIEIFFEDFSNFKKDIQIPYKTEVQYGRNYLFTLETLDPTKCSTFKYNYTYIKGCINPKINRDFTYLLPVGIGKTTETFNIEYLNINKKDPEPKDFYAIGFKTNIGDTIFAARRGIVTSIRDTANLNLSDYAYSSEDNYIEIYHKDCSFGQYQVLKKPLVSLGQEVEAGDPIAIAGGEKYISGSHVRFEVYYNFEQQLKVKNKDGSNIKIYWAYVPLFFYTKEENKVRLNFRQKYISEHPDSIIIQEMTKRQLKKWKKLNHIL